MSNHIFKTEADDAWFYFDPKNVLDTLRVVFVSECNESEDPSDAWRRLSDEAKKNRIEAIRTALKDITINDVEFAHPQVRNACDGITNSFNLFQFMDKNPDAILTHVDWAWDIEYGLSAEDIRACISVGTLLKNLAPFIVEDILDVEAKLYAHGQEKVTSVEAPDKLIDEISPVEEFKAFMKEQYDKYKDKVDAIVDAYNYVANQEGISFASSNESGAIKTVSVDDPVNHPKHYQASNGLEAIDCIEAFAEDLPGDIGYLIGNAMKYLCRFDKKGKPVEDLQKARWYIERAIKRIESRKM